MLCSFCQSLDFRFVGYWHEELSRKNILDDDAQEAKSENADEESSVTDEDSRAQLAEASSAGEVGVAQGLKVANDLETSLLEVLDRKANCDFCFKISTIFEEWALKYWNGSDQLDLTGSKVQFGGYMFGDANAAEEQAGEHSLTVSQLTILTRNPEFPESDNEFHWTGLMVQFQRSNEHPPRAIEICDQLQAVDCRDSAQRFSPWLELKPYYGRMRPREIDFRLIRAWKDLCDITHGESCTQLPMYKDRRPAAIRLIDVQRMCIVNVSDEVAHWVVLSYVWGQQPFRALQRSSLGAFQKPGALDASWVPQTIADAITVTRELGERYLWTDSLCIIQDSAEDKAVFIPLMDLIYGLATVTIVALSGETAHDGLPGVRPGSRPEAQNPMNINGVYLMQAAPPNALGFRDPRAQKRGKYLTRGWTFQELMLSRRLLIFTPDVVFWECRQGYWRENANWEIVDAKLRNLHVFANSLLELDYRDLWSSDISAFDHAYQNLVYDYTRRQLTYESDHLAAFEGILSAFESIAGIKFIWGLPKPFLGVALTWPVDHARGTTRRRGAEYPVSTSKGVVKVTYPSWSWIGWVGPSMFQELFGSLTSEHAGLEFYIFDESHEGHESLIRIPQNQQFTVFDADPYTTHRRAPATWRGDTSRDVTVQDIPITLLAPEIRPAILVFWTSCAKLDFDFLPEEEFWGAFRSEGRGSQGENVSISWNQFPDYLPQGNHQGEFVIVGRGSLEGRRERSELVAFMVERHASGAMTRQTTVTFYEEEWNDLAEKTWELVFLI